MHYVNHDSTGLANDFLSLGFIPDGTDLQLVADALRASFGRETRQSNDFQVIFYPIFLLIWDVQYITNHISLVRIHQQFLL